ncbi:MAG: nucleotidyl transferase [Rhodospirillaceae bacterium]|nr:nucleotidyl transferase [Rhodospirillaceae bacterium]|tara:strand:+ start:53419 stop:54213 length:795 start_codon:yes stop_codon:yes gene_type:complete
MKVLIVAAGRGSRLGVHSDQTPKCLAPFAGSRLLDLQLSVLRGAGLDDIHLVRGYLGAQLDGLGLTLWDNPNWAATNMVASMLCARPVMESGDDVVLAYGDIIYEEKILEALLADDSEASVIVDREWLKLWSLRSDDPLSDAESLRLDDAGNIIDIGRKVPSLEEIQAQYIGLMRFSAKACGELLDILDRAARPGGDVQGKSVANCYMTDLLQAHIDHGGKLHAVTIDGGWIEVDTDEDLARYTALVKAGTFGNLCGIKALDGR